jgi:hypothetical protein
LSLDCRQYLFIIIPNNNNNNEVFASELIDMRRRERALTTEIRLNLNSNDKLSGMSPIFTHRMINLSPLLNFRNNDIFVRA